MMRWLARAGLILSLAVLPLSSACATAPTQSAPPAGLAGAAAGAPSAAPDQIAPAPAPSFDPSGYKVDAAESKALSNYLTQHKLPLVGAQVMRGPDAQRGVVLYGFVGSDYGKQDAIAKARDFLSDQSIAVNNRIKVEPQLLASTGSEDSGASGSAESPAPGDTAAAPSYPGAEAYTQNQQSQADQYVQNQNRNATLSAMAPALMIGMMALSIASGGAFSVGGGPFGPSSGFSSFGGPMGPPIGGAPPGYPSPHSPFGP